MKPQGSFFYTVVDRAIGIIQKDAFLQPVGGNSMDVSFLQLLNSDGKVIRWPKKASQKLYILTYLQSKFEEGKQYSESEVNSILSLWHLFNDHALLRRELYNRYLIDRTPDGRKYWINKKDENTYTLLSTKEIVK